jgi:hypothetical protein
VLPSISQSFHSFCFQNTANKWCYWFI